MINERALATLAAALSLDQIPRVEIDDFFIHAGSGDMDVEVLDAVSATYHRFSYCQPKIVLNGLSPYHHGGAKLSKPNEWLEYLMFGGISRYNIEFTPSRDNTGAEAAEFVRMCGSRGWKRAVIVTRPYHIHRCFLNHVGWVVSLGVTTKFYCMTVSCDWTGEVSVHRNIGGETKASRLAHLGLELKRIRDYREKYEAGDSNFTIATPEEGLVHLASRR